MCIGMCVDMCIDMCIDMYIGMHIGMCVDTCHVSRHVYRTVIGRCHRVSVARAAEVRQGSLVIVMAKVVFILVFSE